MFQIRHKRKTTAKYSSKPLPLGSKKSSINSILGSKIINLISSIKTNIGKYR
jgi:hypothetical protein